MFKMSEKKIVSKYTNRIVHQKIKQKSSHSHEHTANFDESKKMAHQRRIFFRTFI